MVNPDENIRFHELFEWYYDQIAPHKLKDISTARIDALFNKLHRQGSKREMYTLKDAELLAYRIRRPLKELYRLAEKY